MGQHLFKVGHTTGAPQARLRQLQTGNGQQLDLLTAFTCDDPENVEKALHRFLEAKTQRMKGEWFALPREQMLDLLMHLYGGIAQQQGGIRFLASSLATRPSDAVTLAKSCSIASFPKREPSVDTQAIRNRASGATDAHCYSMHTISGTAKVETMGDSFVEIEIPFEALGIWDTRRWTSAHTEYLVALVPEAHADALGNATFFAAARMDVFSLLNEIERLCQQSHTRRKPQIDLEELRTRVYRATEGRELGSYSTFPVTGTAHVGDVGSCGYDYYGDIEVPFEAIAIGGPTHPHYDDHVLALVPKVHSNATTNAQFFAHARADVLALLAEVERLCQER
jgi:hypothetical protein